MNNFESEPLVKNIEGDSSLNITECAYENSNETILEMRVNDKLVGTAELFFHDSPIPHYKVSEIYINPDERGKGYGVNILSSVQEKILSENVAGLLHDVVGIYSENAAAAAGMYERHGWTPVPDREHYFAYNLPAGVDGSLFLRR